MATQHLDLDEQQTVADLKYFWRKWGKLIVATVVGLSLIYGGYVGNQWWVKRQAQAAAGLFAQINAAVHAGQVREANALFETMREQYGSVNHTAQAGLLVARMNYERKDVKAASEALMWVANSGVEAVYRDLAKLRLAGLMIEVKDYVGAQNMLESGLDKSFEALAADRLGDALYLQNKTAEAAAQYQKAYAAIDKSDPYKAMIEVKLVRLGVDVGQP